MLTTTRAAVSGRACKLATTLGVGAAGREGDGETYFDALMSESACLSISFARSSREDSISITARGFPSLTEMVFISTQN